MNIDKVITKVRDAVDESLSTQGLQKANWNNEYIVIPPRTSEYDIFTVPSKSFEMGSGPGVLGRLVRVTLIAGTAYSVGYIKGHIKGVRKARRENMENSRNGK
jgi:hypothetical protein